METFQTIRQAMLGSPGAHAFSAEPPFWAQGSSGSAAVTAWAARAFIVADIGRTLPGRLWVSRHVAVDLRRHEPDRRGR
ncbi:hypothetical protein GCM10009678_32660 [Actinomadura kijaniata]